MGKKSTIRRTSCIVALVMFIALLASGCAGNSETAGQPAVTAGGGTAAPAASTEAPSDAKDAVLTVWLPKTFSANADAMLKERVLAFKEQNPAVQEIKVEEMAATDAYAKWNAAIEAKQTPDITFLHLSAYAPFVDMGVLLPLDDVISDLEKDNGPFVKNYISSLNINGSNYCIPLYGQTGMLIYRKDLLKKAGFENAPATWEELRKVSKAVTDAKNSIYGWGLGYGTADDGEDMQRNILLSFGGGLWTADGKPNANTPENLEAIKFMVDMYKEDKSMPPSVLEWDPSGNNKSYLAGESAMVMNPLTLYKSLQTPEQKELFDNTGVAATPAGKSGTNPLASYISLAVFKESRYQDLSKELLKWVFNLEWYNTYEKENYPVTAPAYEQTVKSDIWQQPVGKLVCDMAASSKPYGYPSTDPKVIVADSKAYTELLVSKTLQKVILQNMEPGQALAELQTRLAEILDGK